MECASVEVRFTAVSSAETTDADIEEQIGTTIISDRQVLSGAARRSLVGGNSHVLGGKRTAIVEVVAVEFHELPL